jgi:hypothetical protein
MPSSPAASPTCAPEEEPATPVRPRPGTAAASAAMSAARVIARVDTPGGGPKSAPYELPARSGDASPDPAPAGVLAAPRGRGGAVNSGRMSDRSPLAPRSFNRTPSAAEKVPEKRASVAEACRVPSVIASVLPRASTATRAERGRASPDGSRIRPSSVPSPAPRRLARPF